jgi:hypothetical protein
MGTTEILNLLNKPGTYVIRIRLTSEARLMEAGGTVMMVLDDYGRLVPARVPWSQIEALRGQGFIEQSQEDEKFYSTAPRGSS